MSKESIELTVNARYSDSDHCVCCEGNHRYTTFLTDADNKHVYAGDLAQRIAGKLKQGEKIKVTVEALNK